MKFKLIMACLLGGAFLGSCSDENEGKYDGWYEGGEIPPMDELAITVEESGVKEGIDKLGFEFANAIADNYDEVCRSDDDNFVFSPLSASFTLAMLANSCGDKMSNDIMAMNGCSDLSAFNIVNNKLLRYLSSNKSLNLYNSVWYSKYFCKLNKDYPKQMRQNYYADVNGVLFDDPETVKLMNAWVSDRTKGEISEFIDKTFPLDLVYIFNTLQFRATWFQPFYEGETEPAEFFGTERNGNVDMMYKKETASYTKTDRFEMIKTALTNYWDLSLILPAEGVEISDLSKSLSYDEWNKAVDQLSLYTVKLFFPRFEVTNKLNLLPIYEHLGLWADENEGVTLDKLGKIQHNWMGPNKLTAFQQTDFSVDENEVRLTAATAVNVLKGAGYYPENEVTMRFDRPFMFVLTYHKLNSVIGIGRICNL